VQELKSTSKTLEIHGPRGQIWRPASGDIFDQARQLTEVGRTYEALLTAQDAYIAKHGDMHEVDFRVVTREVTITVIGAMTPERLEQAQDRG